MNKKLGRIGICLAISITMLFTSYAALTRWQTNNRYKFTQVELRNAARALAGVYIDDCSDTKPDPGNALPRRLTTPVGYLTSLPTDPYSPHSETFRMIDTEEGANGAFYVIASCGPDRDWDVQQLPMRKSVYPPVQTNDQMTLIRTIKGGDEKPCCDNWSADAQGYTTASGEYVELAKTELVFLPPTASSTNAPSSATMCAYFAENGVQVYDPTNGLISNGDIVFFRP